MASTNNLNARVFSISKRRLIPAIIIDVLGNRCSVQLSGSGAVIRNISYSGTKPTKGDSVYIDYSRGSQPIAVTSDSGESNTAPVIALEKPVVTASVAVPNTSVETTPNITGNLYYRGEWDSAVEYMVNNIVIHEDVYYIAVSNNINNEPPNEIYWAVFGSGGGGSLPPMDPNRVVLTDGSGDLYTSNDFTWDAATNTFVLTGLNKSSGMQGRIIANNVLHAPIFLGQVAGNDGADNADATPEDQDLLRLLARGHDGTDWVDSTRAEIVAVADAEWSPTSQSVRWEVYVTPVGSTTKTKVATITSDGHINIESGKEYRVNGAQHKHLISDIIGKSKVRANRATGSSAQTIVPADYRVIQYDTETTDALGEYNTGTYEYTADHDCTVMITASVLTNIYTWASGETLQLAVFKNGSHFVNLFRDTIEASHTSYKLLPGGTQIDLEEGDVLDIRLYSSHSVNIDLLQTSVGNHMEITEL